MANRDVNDILARVAEKLTSNRAARWLSEIEELRATLEVNVNRKIATDALFLGMAAAQFICQAAPQKPAITSDSPS
jgi:hypothetical protein